MNRAGSRLRDRAESPATSVRRFKVEGGLLLLDKSSNTLFAYNDIARCIWELIEAGRSEAEIAAAVAGQWGIPVSLAQDDLRSIAALWRAQGLLAADADKPPHCPSAAGTASAVIIAPSASPVEWTCTIRDTAIAFTIAAELQARVRALFSHLETPGVLPQSRMTIASTPSGEFVLAEDGRERLRTDDAALAIGALHVAVLERIRPGLRWFALLHGAALARQGHGLALVAASGSGKSTLAASLMGAGFDYLADDLVALSSPNAAIVPWPLPLSLKPGSMDSLLSQYPELARATRYRTKDVEARLLIPSPDAWDTEPIRLKTLFFPRFTEGAAPELRRLSTFEALERLLTDRIWLGDPITEDRVTAFLAWLNDTTAYAVSYGKTADAQRLIQSVVP